MNRAIREIVQYRCLGRAEILQKKFENMSNETQRAMTHMGFYCKRWLGVRLGWIDTILIIVAYSVPNVVLFVLSEYRQLSILEMALAISWSLKLVGYFNTFINSVVRVHSAIVSFGRIEYYLTKVKTEATNKRPLAVSYEGKSSALKLVNVSKKFGNREVIKNVNLKV